MITSLPATEVEEDRSSPDSVVVIPVSRLSSVVDVVILISSVVGEVVSISMVVGEVVSISLVVGEVVSISLDVGEDVSISLVVGEVFSISSVVGNLVTAVSIPAEVFSKSCLSPVGVVVATSRVSSVLNVLVVICSLTGEVVEVVISSLLATELEED